MQLDNIYIFGFPCLALPRLASPRHSSLLEDKGNEKYVLLGMQLDNVYTFETPLPFLPVPSLPFPFPLLFKLKLEKDLAVTWNCMRRILQPDFAICSIATGLEIMSTCLNLLHKQECLTIGGEEKKTKQKKPCTLICLLLLAYLLCI